MIDPEKIIYVDEAGIDHNDVYEYAWGIKGPRIYDTKPGGKQERLSIISGLLAGKLAATMFFVGYCTRVIFETWIESVLIPILKPGYTIVFDNASFHKGGRIQTLIKQAGCEVLYLPPYSPDLNKIEHYWFSLKNNIRKALPFNNYNLEMAAMQAYTALAS